MLRLFKWPTICKVFILIRSFLCDYLVYAAILLKFFIIGTTQVKIDPQKLVHLRCFGSHYKSLCDSVMDICRTINILHDCKILIGKENPMTH